MLPTSAFAIFRGPPPPQCRVPCALAIGNFDGVHRGHRALLEQVQMAARARGLAPAALTFEPHPREFLARRSLPAAVAPARIANLRDKIDGLRACGMQRVFVLRFNRRLADMSPVAFIEQVLVQACAMRWLMVGDDFRFGTRRSGDVGLLRAHAAAGAYEVAELAELRWGARRVSSSRVRAALEAGALEEAASLLGHPYFISGRVLHGAKLGRHLGFPTLNLRLPQHRPALHGIYAARVHGLGAAQPGVASIGSRPTVDDSGRWLLEVHLFDFTGEVYGQLVQVEFLQKLRDEEKYDSIAALTAAMGQDTRAARALFAAPGGHADQALPHLINCPTPAIAAPPLEASHGQR